MGSPEELQAERHQLRFDSLDVVVDFGLTLTKLTTEYACAEKDYRTFMNFPSQAHELTANPIQRHRRALAVMSLI